MTKLNRMMTMMGAVLKKMMIRMNNAVVQENNGTGNDTGDSR